MRITSLLAALFLLGVAPLLAAAPAPQVQALGDAAEVNGEWAVQGRSATLVIPAPPAAAYDVSAEVQLAPAGTPPVVVALPSDPGDLAKAGALRAWFPRNDAASLLVYAVPFDAAAGRWPTPAWTQALRYAFLPDAKAQDAAAALAACDIPRVSWRDRWLHLRVSVGRQKVAFWLEGALVQEVERPQGSQGPVALQIAQGDRVRAVRTSVPDPVFLPLDLEAAANARFDQPFGKAQMDVDGVPFRMAGAQECLSLRQAQWIGWQADLPWSHESPMPAVLYDPRMPILRVPLADYCAAHVLAVADDDPALAPTFTLRCGQFSGNGNRPNFQNDFRATVPRRADAGRPGAGRAVRTPAGPLFHVRVPMTHAFSQDLERYLEIEVTKEVRLARRCPDPCRYRYRPLGLPSGVRIAAITLERSPIQMRVSSAEVGNAFVQPQVPAFQVRLANVTPAAQRYALALRAVPLDGTPVEVKRAGAVAAGATADLAVPLPVPKRGYYDLAVILADGKGQTLLRRETSFALLPPDTRRYRDQSPFGTYDFGGAHDTCPDYDRVGPLYVKLGLHYGMFSASPEIRRKYGILKGNEPRAEQLDKALAENPDLPPAALLFHETSISGRQITRVPDLFTDWPAYQLDANEEKAFQKLWDGLLASAKAVRQAHPEVKLAFGNGPLPTKEEFLRRKLPADVFDSLGNESASFGHPPESQPPDWLGNNSSLWMDRQLLDAYGYKEKPITQCHEVCYPATTPGNLDPRTQADYFVRHAIHSLAWGVPRFQPGILMDVGGNYRWSHWGSAGFCRAYPEMNVKPAFVAFATMTLVLDGARFVREVPAGSPSLYAAQFERPDGSQVFVLWTLRGRRPVSLTLEGAGPWKLTDGQGNEAAVAAAGGRAEVTLTPSPVYLTGRGGVAAIAPGTPAYDDRPDGKAVSLGRVSSLDDWVVEGGRSPELEYYDFMEPRRKGDFAFEPTAEFEGETGVMRVTPRPLKSGKDTMPMYAVLAHKRGIPIPGKPTEIGIRINGNSGWGRVIFELTDASGQRWISLGAQAKDDPKDLLPKAILDRYPAPALCDWNTDDAWGLSRINFDGWRYVGFPLPGNYPGEGYPWPANSQWRWDKDGVVHYPLMLRKLVVELPEKVLHLRTWAPPPRPAIYLGEILSAEGDTVKLKRTVGEW